MISFYKWKKNVVFIILGIIPLMVFLLIFFPTIKYYKFEGLQFMYLDLLWVMISIIAALAVAFILTLVGNRLLRHAFTSMLEGKGLLTFILDSTGFISSFNTKVDAPKMHGLLHRPNKPEIEDIYDTDLLHRLFVPKDATLSEATTFVKNEETGELVFGEKVNVLVLPKNSEEHETKFSFEARPVFIFNKVMDKFLSRDALAKFEKDLEIKHNALNILDKIIEIDTSFRNFGRYVGENIKPIKKSIFGSPMFKYIIIGIVIVMIIIIMLMFVPGLLQAGSNLGFP